MLLQLVSIFDSVAKSTFTSHCGSSLLIWVHAVTEIVMVAIKNTKDPLLISGIVFDGLYVLLNVFKILASDTGADLLDAPTYNIPTAYAVSPCFQILRRNHESASSQILQAKISRSRCDGQVGCASQKEAGPEPLQRHSFLEFSLTSSSSFRSPRCLTGFVVGRLFYMKAYAQIDYPRACSPA